MNAPKWFGTPRAWLFVVMAAIGLVLGVLAGMHSGFPPAMAATAGGQCPTARDINSHAVVIVSEKGGRLDINSTLEVRLQDVDPRDPNSTHPARLVSACLLPGAGASLQFLDWSKGSLTARLALNSSALVGASRPDDLRNPVIAETGFQHSTLKVALCDQAGPIESAIGSDLTGVYGEPLVCNPRSHTIIEVRLPTTAQAPHGPNLSPSFEPVPDPFPQHVERKDNNVSYIWSFPGPPPTTPVTVTVNLPLQGFAAEFLDRPPFHWERHFNVRFFAYSLFPFLALLIGWLVLWRSLIGWRLLGIALAVLVLGNLRVPGVPVLFRWEVGLAIAWWIVLLSIATKLKWRWAVTGTVAAGIACLILVLADPPLGPVAAHAAPPRLGAHPKVPPINAPHHSNLQLTAAFSALAAVFLVLVLTAVILLFHQLMKTFNLRKVTKTTDYGFRNTVTCVGILGLSFMYWFDLNGLPRSVLHSPTPLESLATGIAGSVVHTSQWGGWPLARVGALVVVAFLAVKLCSQPDWGNGLRAALMFGLAAPWSPNGDDVVVAVLSALLWPLQLLIIWIGFRQLLKRQPQIVPADKEGSLEAAEKDHASAEAASELQLQAGAGGSPLGNAYLAARQAGYLSVPLVLYFVWTTLGQLHDVLNADWGILIVFIGIVAEAARWV